MNTKNKNLIRQTRIREKIKKTANGRFRLSIFRSSKNIYAQIIDDNISKTLVSASSKDKDITKETKGKKGDVSKIVAKNLFKKAAAKKINSVYFDRGKYRYHGRIKILADTLRSEGMKL